MSGSLTISAGLNSGWRERLVLAAVCLLLLPGGVAMAEESDDQGGNVKVVETGVASAPDAEAVPSSGGETEEPAPLVLERFAPRPLTAADMPPASPLAAYSTLRGSAVFGRDWRAGRNEYRTIIEREAHAFGIPPALVDSVMAVESRYNPGVVGLDGEIGLMQVMPSTARMLGFTGSAGELAQPEVNVHYGVKYLAGAWRLAAGDVCTATMKYRAGHGETRFSFLSVEYCTRVRERLTAQGVRVTGSVPQPTFGRRGSVGAPAGGSRHRSIGGGGSVNFAALNARLREVADRRGSNELR